MKTRLAGPCPLPSIVRFWMVASTPFTNTIGLVATPKRRYDCVSVAGLAMTVVPQPAPVMVSALFTTTCSSNVPAPTAMVWPPSVSASSIAAWMVAKYSPVFVFCTARAEKLAVTLMSAVTSASVRAAVSTPSLQLTKL